MRVSKFKLGAVTFIAILSFFHSGCEPEADRFRYTDPQILVTIDPADKGVLSVNSIKAVIGANGVISSSDGMTYSAPFFSAKSANAVVACSGIWIGVDGPSPRVNLVAYSRAQDVSNFTEYLDTIRAGLFHVTPAQAEYIPPIPLARTGFPVKPDGKVRIFGDEMYWSAMQGKSIPGSSLFSSPHYTIRVNQTVLAFRNQDYRNLLFIRYDITNVSEVEVKNIYAGYWSDTDIDPVSSGNSTGYDQSRGLTYTYAKSKMADPNASLIAGFTFLESPVKDPMYPHGVTSHRIMRKNNYIDPQFGETDFGPVQALYALKGLSNSGQSMIDPKTENETRFAFTGDPGAGTGWLDESLDTRNMISAGPFDLKGKETKTLVVLWICTAYADFKINLSSMQSQLDKIRQEQFLWR